MRWKFCSVRRCGRRPCKLACGVKTARCQRRVIITVEQVVQESWMVGDLATKLFQNFCTLQFILERPIGWRTESAQSVCVKDFCLVVIGIFLVYPLQCRRVCPHPSLVTSAPRVFIKDTDGCDVSPLAWGFCTDERRLVGCLFSQAGMRPWPSSVQTSDSRSGDSPVRHAALRILLGHRRECVRCFRKRERVEHCQSLVKSLLHFWLARDLQVNLAKAGNRARLGLLTIAHQWHRKEQECNAQMPEWGKCFVVAAWDLIVHSCLRQVSMYML